MRKTIKNLEEMRKFAISVANKTKVGKKAVIFGLYGDLGSGKTTFTKGFVESFGVKQNVTSPTFVIEKIYKLPNKPLGRPTSKFKHIIHIDAYRLSGGEEMLELGWNEIIENLENIILIEWPEKINDILPKNIKKIEFTFVDENKRIVNY
ncbi:MAG: tRNA (adenosine(37)-N6)-threonylcarbamoyltransferase complex ATPase subunit type 1 TsaE [Candidatus Pacebacteria bacterium]|nr:tRNA (adenosine(37)-N6)-threonylcarbamoyltransferase complex ATPase subunit type 1 TsaE [Candidatus Paceibacterota bacterium]